MIVIVFRRWTVPEPGFTAVACRSEGCADGDAATVADDLFSALRTAVRDSRHGVLVSAGCLLGQSICGARATAPVVLVQRCNTERRPVGAGVRIGPLRTAADVEAVVAWLRSGALDPRRLPAHVLSLHCGMSAAPLN
jgi:hypothetical protein